MRCDKEEELEAEEEGGGGEGQGVCVQFGEAKGRAVELRRGRGLPNR